MGRAEVDSEIDAIEAHAWRVRLENGDAMVCRRCGNPFVPAGGRRDRDGKEVATDGKEMTRDSEESVPESEVPVAGGEVPAVDLCGSCVPLRLLEYGDKRARRPECIVCGGRISGRRGGTLYCKEACRKAAYRARVRDKTEGARTARDSDETEVSGDDIASELKHGQPASEEGFL